MGLNPSPEVPDATTVWLFRQRLTEAGVIQRWAVPTLPLLAIAIAGGLGGATLLALYYIPSAYRLLSNRGPVAVG